MVYKLQFGKFRNEIPFLLLINGKRVTNFDECAAGIANDATGCRARKQNAKQRSGAAYASVFSILEIVIFWVSQFKNC